ncbi:DUF5692 family protein [Gordonibacter urolithinfaciens]|uniref:Uncharacterized protein n=1 Tax=Gordonibacter urolithinfaciens TaxID=1335613 RepID=A0A6N8IMY3_9ACTN|nr:DUF5692 family protein [Gordonibacter urolithinfaciens]MVM56105.1 hypothetical protein [Gordonibacter urolithinfaciens]MVN16676.1 hypothetical protein [Gordonibacter urolithinfaciens]MVN40116.1 hypothetical protein [Gordonibacter urolithinfaciens]MVN57262.1 hypothetical protein [Gordonibacter urolithinfaciens]MVN62491.1 hypothetical protein [Gordonibacter urolithinfaciens]
MLFQVYGENALYQWLGWAMVFIGLIPINEVARRSKIGGTVCFIGVPLALTAYFVAIYVGAGMGADWALNNPTYLHMNSWFHYAKLYAATIGCIGFMALKYRWGKIGKSHWFKCFPFVIVAINILIAVVSDFESAFRAFGTTWVSSEGVTLYGGWHNVFNGVAGLINIACMTGWFGIYVSKKKQDMLWPDMTWVFILAYDLWNFCYTYNCLPTHSFYCGLALLLAPTVAAMFWNKGGWIQNRAFTLAIWCMFAQVFPAFQDYSVFSVQSVNNPNVNLAVSVIALVANVAAFTYIMYRARKLKVNPYLNEVFVGTRDYEEAMARREDAPQLPRSPKGDEVPQAA